MRWLVAISITLAACKGNPEKCDKACRNYAQLVFWQGATVEINAAPPEKRDALRKAKSAEFAADLEKHIDFCTSQCVTANNDSQTECMIEARTADAAKKCTAD